MFDYKQKSRNKKKKIINEKSKAKITKAIERKKIRTDSFYI